jgi:hypothetical protein
VGIATPDVKCKSFTGLEAGPERASRKRVRTIRLAELPDTS